MEDISELNKKPIILLDMDDCMNNFLEALVRLHNEKNNDNYYWQNVRSWDLDKYLGENIYKLMETPGLFSIRVVPREGSVEATQILSKYYEIYILTSCVYPQNILEKYKFVEKWFPHIGIERIITAKNKGLFIGDYMIDDYINNLKASKCEHKIMLSTPANSFVEITDNIIRMPSWNDILWWFAMKNDELMEELMQIECEKEQEIDKRSEEHLDNITSFFLLKNIFKSF